MTPMFLEPLKERVLVRYARARFRRSVRAFAPPERPPGPPGEPIHLYLHVPFCEEPCVYCSFHRVPFRLDAATAYFTALREEMRSYARRGFVFDSLAVGGGTPTVMPEELARTLELARRLWPIRGITVETNPTHVSPSTVALLETAGVDRLSVGVQSLRDDVLEKLGRRRYGSSAQIREILTRNRGVFCTLNADIIFGYPGQTADDLASEVGTLREIGVDQITFYPLMLSSRTHRALRLGMAGAPTPLGDLYAAIRDGLDGEYRASSAWCFSRGRGTLTDEYISSRYAYAGLGAGAFSLMHGSLWATTFSVSRYVRMVQDGETSIVLARRMSPSELAQYRLLMSLFGGSVRVGPIVRETGIAGLPVLLGLLGFLAVGGALRRHRGALEPNRRGQFWSLLLMREFFQGVNDFRDACRAESRKSGDLGDPES
jgi:coproporphyrinogen III oxidase-like Fe-S oxidoreductase